MIKHSIYFLWSFIFSFFYIKEYKNNTKKYLFYFIYPAVQNAKNIPKLAFIPKLSFINPKNYATIAHPNQLQNTAIDIPYSFNISASYIYIYYINLLPKQLDLRIIKMLQDIRT